MGLYNFRPQFVPYILDGSKNHTIRATRKHPDKPGDVMHLYTGLRQKGAKLLGRFPCAKVEEIELLCLLSPRIEITQIPFKRRPWIEVFVDGDILSPDECEALARRDGFPEGFGQMMHFWEGRLPFQGQIYHWRRP